MEHTKLDSSVTMQANNEGAQDREFWLKSLERLSRPVLEALAEDRLRERMPVESSGSDRALYTHLEAIGRLLCGIAPWLDANHGDSQEQALRAEFRELTTKALEHAFDPTAKDYMNLAKGYQPIVDAAFLCQAILRAPNTLWHEQREQVKTNIIHGIKQTRTRKPYFNNWLLFSGMIEAMLYHCGESDWDPMRIDYGIKQHEQWYVGDGVYGDGIHYHADYYNSFVIQPMLLDMVETVGQEYPDWSKRYEVIKGRAQRYAEQLERMISPEGTFPPLGRSIAYRTGAFQLLAQLAWKGQLPESLQPAQVRGALTAVMKRCLDVPNTYDEQGWLRIGLSGHQPSLGEEYISTGSLYLCSTVLLPLALSPEDSYWNGTEPWTSKRLWSGADSAADHALYP